MMALAKDCHHALLKEAERVMTTVLIDDRTDKPGPRLHEKVDSLARASGLELKR